jgi:thiopurine S-methyltransferase
VIAVDWSEYALKDLMRRYGEIKSSLPGTIEVASGDFFSIAPQHVDLVCEHTFFCAIDPAARPRYVKGLSEWLAPGGFLVGNFFIVSDEDAQALPGLSLVKPASPVDVGRGPPFATTVSELEGLLRGAFERVTLYQSQNSEPSRRPGIEWVGVLRRR